MIQTIPLNVGLGIHTWLTDNLTDSFTMNRSDTVTKLWQLAGVSASNEGDSNEEKEWDIVNSITTGKDTTVNHHGN